MENSIEQGLIIHPDRPGLKLNVYTNSFDENGKLSLFRKKTASIDLDTLLKNYPDVAFCTIMVEKE